MSTQTGEMSIVLSMNAASYSQSIDLAARKLDELAGKSKKIGTSTISSVQAASGALRELNGDFANNIRAVERFITTIPGVGTALKAAFPLVGGVAFAAMIGEATMKVYDFAKAGREAAKNTARAFDEMNDSTHKTGAELDIANDKLANIVAKLEHKPQNLIKEALDEDRKAAYDMAEEVDRATTKVRALLKEHGTGIGTALGNLALGRNVAITTGSEKVINDAEGGLRTASRANVASEESLAPGPDAEVVKLQNRTKMLGAYEVAIQKVDKQLQAVYARQRTDTDHTDFSNETEMLEDSLDSMKSGRHNTAAGYSNADLTTQKDRDEKAKQDAADARKAAAERAAAARKAAEDSLRAMEQTRVTEEQAGKLGAQADLDYWRGKLGAFRAGSTEYLSVQRKIFEDQKSLGRSGEQFDAEQARGAEVAAKNAGALERANVQLALASHAISKLTADERTGAAQAAEYTAKISALRLELQQLNADAAFAPEDKKNKAAALQNAIAAESGAQAAAAVQERARAVSAMNAERMEALENVNALVALTAATRRESESLAQMVLAHNVATGAISKHDQAMQLASQHANEYAAQLADLAAERERTVDPENGMGNEQRTKALAKIDRETATVQGQASVTALQDKWAAQEQTAVGGFISAMEEIRAASKDHAAQIRALSTEMVSDVNRTLVQLLTTRSSRHDHLGRTLAHDALTKVTAASLSNAEGTGVDMVAKIMGLAHKGKNPVSAAAAAAVGKLTGGAGPAGTENDPIYVATAKARQQASDMLDKINVRLPAMPDINLPQLQTMFSTPAGGSSAMGMLGTLAARAMPFIPGFAGGVDNFQGGLAWIGEEGPELMHLPRGSSITSNRNLTSVMGGGDTHHHWNIDARGANDPAQMHAAIRRGIAEAAPHIAAATLAKGEDDRRRRIGGRG